MTDTDKLGMYKNIFVLSAGRVGSEILSKALSHANNYTVGHETDRAKDFSYPDYHIEIDNRLAWFLGDLDEIYDSNETLYVWLYGNRHNQTISLSRRYNHSHSIMRAFGDGILMGAVKKKLDIAVKYVECVEDNIQYFTSGKENVAYVDSSNTYSFRNSVHTLWADARMCGDYDACMDELSKFYNASKNRVNVRKKRKKSRR